MTIARRQIRNLCGLEVIIQADTACLYCTTKIMRTPWEADPDVPVTVSGISSRWRAGSRRGTASAAAAGLVEMAVRRWAASPPSCCGRCSPRHSAGRCRRRIKYPDYRDHRGP